MVNHILNEHKEYSVPGHRVSGVALPVEVWMGVKLTKLEQSASCIAKERWQVGQEGDKECDFGSLATSAMRAMCIGTSAHSSHGRPCTAERARQCFDRV
jgi:hypothetical protein